MTIFEWFQLVAGNVWLYGGSFLLVLSILVFIHEWGHYIIARRCGVRVEVFSIGFGREIFGFTDKNKTRWKFSLIPLGGYVKLFGDVDPASAGHTDNVQDEDAQIIRQMTEEERKVAFFSQPVAKRAAVVFAGPAINYLFAILILTCLYTFNGKPITPPVATAIVGDSAAERAGFRPHDKIIAIDGEPINSFEDIRRDVMVGLDEERIFTIERGNETIEVATAPDRVEEEDSYGFKSSRGMLGIIGPGNAIDINHIVAINGRPIDGVDAVRAEIESRMNAVFSIDVKSGPETTSTMVVLPHAAENEAFLSTDSPDRDYLMISDKMQDMFVKHNFVESTALAIRETIDITKSTLNALGQMVTGHRSATELGGIIRIGAIAGDMAQLGLVALITFTALLSINLGLINLFPIPTLDGGHLLFYAFETIKGKPISEHVQDYAFRIGFVMLVGLMLFANINDIMQLIL